ncbi:uncharacterized protein LOC117545708 isoform X2 [Gymnodraco acuticeps]|uniref:Uncharacterized protein LOC117545708 isoform X2 n=1 Tax=Gymnodraco acuticeps TaxID=8218 RepID=A0A6P8UI73_GYMAC|nr:uncharacterized protein LOC117545708 isoform X2 [Gymnodraco acuticeps]XP_034071515.1 uncharacterized protein LOC117545708 isoform X2 [Gymnodraco acuticeps]XP_034071516.1 uncharacterized protein LOC117545708 isoform X2 [Gymnodraco acuticeps]
MANATHHRRGSTGLVPVSWRSVPPNCGFDSDGREGVLRLFPGRADMKRDQDASSDSGVPPRVPQRGGGSRLKPPQVYCEFNRVVGKNLKDNFFDALDRFSPSLMDLFRKKKGVTGQFLSELLSQTKTTEPTDIRCLCVRGLPIILGDKPSAFFKTCTDAADKEVYSQTPLGILCVGENPQLNPSSVAIVLEGNVVMDGPANLPQAFCVLFRLIYALQLEYPKCMKNTFHFVQQVILKLGKVELAPKIQTLKNQLTL